MLLRCVQILAKGVLLSALASTCTLANPAQISSEQFRKLLADKASFEAADFSALDNGEPVVKLLRVKDKKQVAVCGVVRLQDVSEITMSVFRDSLTQKANKSMLASGEFSTPPVIDDLQSLTVDEVEDLKKCIIGNCDVKMSAAMIKRMQTEVDWNAQDYQKQAGRLYKQMLVDYASAYLKRGDRALMQYDSRKTPVRLAEEYRRLLDESLFVKEFAPEFAQYLKDFPSSERLDVENGISWSKITFGLDPIITITHNANYSRRTDIDSQLLIATKQIYASRYFNSSLAFAMLVTIRKNDAANAYVIFTNVSRSNVLDGPFSNIKHSLVEKEATDRASEVLSQAKLRLEKIAANNVEPTPQPDETGFLSRAWRLGQHPAVRVLLVVLLGLTIGLIYREWRLNSNRIDNRK